MHLKFSMLFWKAEQIAEGVIEKILQSMTVSYSQYSLLKIASTFCSRGGKTTKFHALFNENFQLINVILTGGEYAIDFQCSRKKRF